MTVTWTAINNGYRLGLRLSAYNGEENTDHHHTNKGCSLEQWQIHECLQKARFLSVRVRICNTANGANQLIHWLELADAAAHIHPPQFTHGTYGWIQLPWSNQKALGHFIPGQHEWRRHLHPTLVSWHWNPSCQRFHCVRFGNISLLVIPATGVDCAGRGIDSATWRRHQFIIAPSSTQPRAGCSLETLSYWERIVLRIVTIFIFVFKNTILVMKYIFYKYPLWSVQVNCIIPLILN